MGQTALLIAGLLLMTGAAAGTGSHQPPPFQRGGAGFLALGLEWTDLEDLNRTFRRTGFPPLEERFVSLGGGVWTFLGRVLIGGEGHGILDQRTTVGRREAHITGFQGFFDLGYLIARSPAWQAYGLIGLGGGRWFLRIQESGRLPDFRGLLRWPEGSARLMTGGVLLQAAVGLDVRLPVVRRPRYQGDFLLGLRVSYVWQPGEAGWRLDDGTPIVGGPDVRLTGPSVRLTLGWQRLRMRRSEASRP
ncbi:MAG: hypothetical protein NZ742_07975 [Acidobacteria bacterium]|nr:hypothetical protein [Acidobacteriota bacterium]MDW7985370.1 hypothetical protein [Acidobacteriota bacterium]